MYLAVEFVRLVGWAAILTAGLTAIAAYGCAVAAREAADLVRSQLREAHRPLVIPQCLREDDEADRLIVGVRNIGLGPALSARGRIQTGDPSFAMHERGAEGGVAGIAPGEEAELAFALDAESRRKLGGVRLSFDDTSGDEHIVESVWKPSDGGFVRVSLTERTGRTVRALSEATARARWN